jgi:RNA polymerase sigma factor (sigma-70 family)
MTATSPQFVVADRNAQVLAHRSLATRAARRFVRDTTSRDDLEQVASIGLIKAVEHHRPDLGPFKPYAWRMIIGELMHYVRDHESLVRPPRRADATTRRMLARYVDLPLHRGDQADFTEGVALRAALSALTNRERAIVLGIHLGGYTQADVGAATGISQSHASKILRAALGKMRRALDATAYQQ